MNVRHWSSVAVAPATHLLLALTPYFLRERYEAGSGKDKESKPGKEVYTRLVMAVGAGPETSIPVTA